MERDSREIGPYPEKLDVEAKTPMESAVDEMANQTKGGGGGNPPSLEEMARNMPDGSVIMKLSVVMSMHEKIQALEAEVEVLKDKDTDRYHKRKVEAARISSKAIVEQVHGVDGTTLRVEIPQARLGSDLGETAYATANGVYLALMRKVES